MIQIPYSIPIAEVDLPRCFIGGVIHGGGPDLNSTKGHSHLTCQSWCWSVEECKYFNWRESDQKCFLKETNVGMTVKPGLISGPRQCSQDTFPGVTSEIQYLKLPKI